MTHSSSPNGFSVHPVIRGLLFFPFALYLSVWSVRGEGDGPATEEEDAGSGIWFSLDTGDIWTFEDEQGRMSIKILAEEAIGDGKAYRVGWFEGDSEAPYQVEYWRKDGERYVVVAREIAGRKLVFDEPYVFLKETVQPGDTWTATLQVGPRKMELKFEAGEKEAVETGIGEFEAIKLSVTGPPQAVERWYVPSIGMVKEITRLSLGGRTSPGNEKLLVQHTEGESEADRQGETDPSDAGPPAAEQGSKGEGNQETIPKSGVPEAQR